VGGVSLVRCSTGRKCLIYLYVKTSLHLKARGGIPKGGKPELGYGRKFTSEQRENDVEGEG